MKKALYWLILLLLVVGAGLINFSALEILKGHRFLVVQSSSMAPAIQPGSLVIVKKASDYQKGEVITFRNEKESAITMTHRIVKVKDGKLVTKGDANQAIDSQLVTKSLVLGKVSSVIPFLGQPISFAKTLPGLIILIVMPALLIIGEEILNIKNEIRQKFRL